MTGPELASIGAALYGARWQTAMARVLGLRRETLCRYAGGAMLIPAVVAWAVFGLVAEARRVRGHGDAPTGGADPAGA